MLSFSHLAMYVSLAKILKFCNNCVMLVKCMTNWECDSFQKVVINQQGNSRVRAGVGGDRVSQ